MSLPGSACVALKDQSKGFVSLRKTIIIQGWIKISQVCREGNQQREPEKREVPTRRAREEKGVPLSFLWL